ALPEGRERGELAVDLRFDLHNALIPLGDVGRMADMLKEAEAQAEQLQDQRRLGQVAAHMTQRYWRAGHPGPAVESGVRAMGIAQTLHDRTLESLATQRLGQAYASLGDYRRAVDAFGQHLARVEAGSPRRRSVSAGMRTAANRAWMAWCLAPPREVAESGAHAKEALPPAEASPHHLTPAMAHPGAARSPPLP